LSTLRLLLTTNCALLKEMQAHFIKFWKDGGASAVVEVIRRKFHVRNDKLLRKDSTFVDLAYDMALDFESLAIDFRRLTPKDFVFGFHAFPDNSVGHLHMHVYPNGASLRKFSTKRRDHKTIPLEAVLEVEEQEQELSKEL